MIVLYVGSYGRPIEIPVLLDGKPWDITAGAVHLIFTKPSGAIVTAEGIPGNGKVTYVIEEGLLNEVGTWRYILTINLDSVQDTFMLAFEVRGPKS